MSPAIRAELEYFDKTVPQLNLPADESDIRQAEVELQTTLPRSMRAFLLEHNGGRIADVSLCGVVCPSGVPPIVAVPQLVKATGDWRETLRLDRQSREQYGLALSSRSPGENLLVVADKGTGDPYALLPQLRSAAGECAIAQVDHETCEVMAIVASSYERLIWFLVNDMRNQCNRDGGYKPEFLIRESKWPFADRQWVLSHDPGLSQWANLYPHAR
jgi:hypothetical protein